MNTLHRKKDAGFTLVELMLSMSFIAVMLIAIALCIMQMSTIYNRGETLRHINQSVRSISVDLQQTLGAADSSAITFLEGGGRLCTGKVSYIWGGVTDAGANKFPYNIFEGPGSEAIRLLRVADPGAVYCSNPDHPISSTASSVELLADGDRPLLVHSLSVAKGIQGKVSGQQLYSLRILLGTDNIEEIDADAGTCRPPSELGADFNYCAVNEFTLTVRTGVR